MSRYKVGCEFTVEELEEFKQKGCVFKAISGGFTQETEWQFFNIRRITEIITHRGQIFYKIGNLYLNFDEDIILKDNINKIIEKELDL